MPVAIPWHAGERAAQRARGFEESTSYRDPPYEDSLTPFQATFFSELHFLPFATLDSLGRPWASLVAGRKGTPDFINPVAISGREGMGVDGKKGNDAKGLWMRVPVSIGHPLRFCLPAPTAVEKQVSVQGGMKVLQDGEDRYLAASVGLMLHNRRRNKLEGWIEGWSWAEDVDSNEIGNDLQEDDLELVVGVTNTLGNCPKYINKRLLAPSPYKPKLLAPSPSTFNPYVAPTLAQGERLPQEALDVLAVADLVYLATRCVVTGSKRERSHMGANSKGGRPGFVRHFFDEKVGRPCLVLPDFSGNRFMNSIGNLAVDPSAGLAIPHFGFAAPSPSSPTEWVPVRLSRVLHVTGRATVLNGDDAKRIIRGVQACIMIHVDGYTLVEGGLTVAIDGRVGAASLGGDTKLRLDDVAMMRELEDASFEWSPYNPPLRLLSSEKTATAPGGGDGEVKALLTKVEFWAHDLATFHWAVPLLSPPTATSSGNDATTSQPPPYKSGQFVILDTSSALATRVTSYTHMARFKGGERELNDDGVRSWTISSTPSTRTVEEVEQKGVADEKEVDKTKMRMVQYGEFSTTIRLKAGGAITPGLFERAQKFSQWMNANAKVDPDNRRLQSGLLPDGAPRVEFPLLGFDGTFTLPHPLPSTKPLRFLYMAHGIGLTPIMAHLESLAGSISSLSSTALTSTSPVVDVLVVLAAREHELKTLEGLILRSLVLGSVKNGKQNGNVVLNVQLIFLSRPIPDLNELETARTMGVPESSFSPLPSPSSSPSGQSLSSGTTLSTRTIRNTRISDALFLPNTVRKYSSLDGKAADNDLDGDDPLRPPNITSRAVFICGTPGFDKSCKRALKGAEANAPPHEPQVIISESFAF